MLKGRSLGRATCRRKVCVEVAGGHSLPLYCDCFMSSYCAYDFYTVQADSVDRSSGKVCWRCRTVFPSAATSSVGRIVWIMHALLADFIRGSPGKVCRRYRAVLPTTTATSSVGRFVWIIHTR